MTFSASYVLYLSAHFTSSRPKFYFLSILLLASKEEEKIQPQQHKMLYEPTHKQGGIRDPWEIQALRGIQTTARIFE